MAKAIRNIFWICLTVGIIARLLGAYVNLESNDDHVEVVQRMIVGKDVSHRDSCWECFQPPLLYRANTKVVELIGKTDRIFISRFMQFQNAIMSLLAIWFTWLFMLRLNIKEEVRRIIIGFWLINPALMSISIQSTNDTIIVLLACMAAYWFYRSIQLDNWKYLIGVATVASLAPHFKGSGLALFGIFSLLVLFQIIRNFKERWSVLPVVTIGVIVLVFFSRYTHNYETYGHPLTTNLNKPAPPPLFDDGAEFWMRPGITSIATGYFTFPLGSMLKQPFNINSGENYPKHRTSFWAQMYGSFYHIQFLNHPWSWRCKHPDMMNLARIIFIVALVPTSLFFIALFVDIRSYFKLLITGHLDRILIKSLLLGLFGAYLFFALKYSHDYRDFGCIKSIFILPAMIPISTIFASGVNTLRVNSKLRTYVIFTILLVTVLCIASDVFLLSQLTELHLKR